MLLTVMYRANVGLLVDSSQVLVATIRLATSSITPTLTSSSVDAASLSFFVVGNMIIIIILVVVIVIVAVVARSGR